MYPNLDILILESISEMKLNTSVLPDSMGYKVKKLITGKCDLSKFTLEERLILLSSMGITTYIYTTNNSTELNPKTSKDIIPSLVKNITHRQLAAISKLKDNNTVVLSDKDVIKTMEAAYFLLNKKVLNDSLTKTDLIKTSSIKNVFDKTISNRNLIDNFIKTISSFKINESKILIEGKLNENQYIILMKLWRDNLTPVNDILNIINGSKKKKYSDITALELRGAITIEKIINNKTKTVILTSIGRVLISSLIQKYIQ